MSDGGAAPAMSSGQMLASRGLIGSGDGGGGGDSGGISFDMDNYIRSIMQAMETSTLAKSIFPFISALKAMQPIALEALSGHILGCITPSLGSLSMPSISKGMGFGKGG